MRISIACLLTWSLAIAGCPAEDSISFSLVDLPQAQLRTPYDHQLSVAGTGQEIRYALSAGKLPFGLQLEPDGRLHGMPTAAQHAQFTVEALAVSGHGVWQTQAQMTVSDPQGMRLLVEDLPVAQPGQAYSHTLGTVGGSADSFRLIRARTFFESEGDPNLPLPNDEQAPQWLQLNPESGTLSGTPDDREVVVLLLVEARAGSRQVLETYALRVGDPAQDGWLLSKSEKHVQRQTEAHVPSGLHLAFESDACFSNYGDSCCWSSTSMGGLAFRAAVLGTPESVQAVLTRLQGMRTLRLITGVPGLPGRAYEHRENIDGPCGHWFMDPQSHEHQYQGQGEYSDYRLWGDASRDQLTGNFWGHAIVWEVLPQQEELRALAAENIVSIASHVWDNEMKVIDLDGEVTRFGTMSGYGFDGLDPYELGVFLPNGMNASMLLNWFQLAAQVAPDSQTRQAFSERLTHLMADEENPEPGREFEFGYLDILEDSYAYAAYPAGTSYFADMKWYNAHMAFSTYFHLVRKSRDPQVRQRLMQAFTSILWQDEEAMESGCDKPELRRARREGNPHFSFQYLAALGDRDGEVLFESLSQLMWFRESPRGDYPLANPLGVETIPDHPDWACEPLPVHLRPQSSNYIWHRDPYRHTGGNDTPGREDGGGDGFVPYWMGRYFGFIPENI